jgi:RND family efflux transporter MFP subunit
MVVGSVVLALAGRWLLASAAAANAIKSPMPTPVSVRVSPLSEKVVSAGVRYSGLVRELRKSDLSFRVSGTVAYLKQLEAPGGRMRDLHAGDTLPAGTVIARLDTDDYERDKSQAAQKLAMAIARLEQARANAERAQLDHRRNELLKERNAVSLSTVDDSRTKLKEMVATVVAAEGDVEAARISLKQAEANLAYCSLAVPFHHSTIASRLIDNNERVVPGQVTFTVVDVSSVVIAFNVPDTLVGRLSIGQKFEVTADALPDRKFEAVMHKIASTADTQTRTYPVEVRIDDPGGLRPGMVATVVLDKEARAYLLPLTSVSAGDAPGQLAVFRLERSDGRSIIRRIPVNFDDLLDNKVAVRMGEQLVPGDKIVATGVHRLRDGQDVHVVE